MRFSFWVGNGHSWHDTLEACSFAERTGWDGIWIADHFMPLQGDGPTHEAWSMLAALAATVPRVRIGPMVAGNTYRNPAVLAKQATTVDHISGGRVVLGLGAGWQENEHEAYGIEFNNFRWRFDRLEEACQIIKGLMADERTSFSGEHYQIADAPLDPKPVQGSIPLLIGGGGEKRTLRIVAQYADEWNVWGTPDVLAQKVGVLDQHCADLGRDPASIQRSAVALLFLSDDQAVLDKLRGRDLGRPSLIGRPDELRKELEAYAEAGVDELIIPDFNFRGTEDRETSLTRFLEEAAADYR